MPCSHRIEGTCKHQESKFFGVRVNHVCMSCPLYDGPDRGLGDTIKRIANATGVTAVVDTVSRATGTDCGCQQRREKLNEMFPRDVS